MDYRHLTEDEILRLKSQSCLADDWGKVTVAEEEESRNTPVCAM